MPDDCRLPSEGEAEPETCRPARPADLTELTRLEQSAFRTDRLSRRRLRWLIGSPSTRFLVAEKHGRIVGYALVLTRKGSGVARLYSLAVAPGHTGGGIGRRLLEAAERSAAKAGAERLRLEVRADNAAAGRLYAAAGYRRIAALEDYYEDGAAAFRCEKRLATIAAAPAARNIAA